MSNININIKNKRILFFYTDLKFKDYVKENNPKIYSESIFEKGGLQEYNKNDFIDIEILSIFIDSQLTKDELKKFPKLKLIATRGTGIDHIDQDYCEKNNIKIKNVSDYGSQTVAEFALSSLLYQLKNLGNTNVDKENRGLDLADKTIGVIGFGKIGKNFVKLVSPFGVKILVSDPYPDKEFTKKFNLKFVSLKNLLQNSDIISIHAPLCKSTYHLLGKKEIGLMKDGVILVNTARGAILDTKYLFNALKSGKISEASLDVLEEENDLVLKNTKNLNKKRKDILQLNRQIIKMKNVFYTSHQAYNTKEAVKRIWKKTIDNIKNN
ncbi:MAG: hydroxyacid dehydrogenase [Candidatus Pacebacteria bacterium]|nr:hydroxyacid dehydrogenase [Candidatus Paceibacterota bacterium]